MNWHNAIWKRTWISCKCKWLAAKSRANTKRVLKKYEWYAKKGENGIIKYSTKTTKGRAEDKKRSKEQGQQTENSNKYGRYLFNYIN